MRRWFGRKGFISFDARWVLFAAPTLKFGNVGAVCCTQLENFPPLLICTLGHANYAVIVASRPQRRFAQLYNQLSAVTLYMNCVR